MWGRVNTVMWGRVNTVMWGRVNTVGHALKFFNCLAPPEILFMNSAENYKIILTSQHRRICENLPIYFEFESTHTEPSRRLWFLSRHPLFLIFIDLFPSIFSFFQPTLASLT